MMISYFMKFIRGSKLVSLVSNFFCELVYDINIFVRLWLEDVHNALVSKY